MVVYPGESQFDACCRYELGRQPANTKLSSHVAVRRVRVRGGNYKFRALRLDHGNFSWGTEVQPSCGPDHAAVTPSHLGLMDVVRPCRL